MKKSSEPVNKTEEVDAFMKELDHPFKAEVEAIRKIIKKVNKGITEEIKWKAPSFSYRGYLVTFNLWEKKRVHLVFHNGAILKDKNGSLEGNYPVGLTSLKIALMTLENLFLALRSTKMLCHLGCVGPLQEGKILFRIRCEPD